ncbi:MAG: hypothetical protein AAB217_03855, partial [Chloroflexota bacterium]
MRDWKLTQNDPLALRLAADVRFGPTDYADDQIWELTLTGGEPSAVAARTTYGLRAREMRLFPGFREGEALVTDPDQFSSPPVVHRFAVNRIEYSFSPLGGIHVQAVCWVPNSHSLAGQFTITNESTATRSIRLKLNAILHPLESGTIMGHARIGPLNFLQGQTGTPSVAPVVLLEGGLPVDSGAMLARSLDLAPGETQTVRWAQAACQTPEAGIEMGRALLERSWADDFARI